MIVLIRIQNRFDAPESWRRIWYEKPAPENGVDLWRSFLERVSCVLCLHAVGTWKWHLTMAARKADCYHAISINPVSMLLLVLLLIKVPCNQWWCWRPWLWCQSSLSSEALVSCCVIGLKLPFHDVHKLSDTLVFGAPRSPSLYLSSHHAPNFQDHIFSWRDSGKQVANDGFFSPLFAVPITASLNASST